MLSYIYDAFYYIKYFLDNLFTTKKYLVLEEYDPNYKKNNECKSNETLNDDYYLVNNLTKEQYNFIDNESNQIESIMNTLDIDKMYEDLKQMNTEFSKTTKLKLIVSYLKEELNFIDNSIDKSNLSYSWPQLRTAEEIKEIEKMSEKETKNNKITIDMVEKNTSIKKLYNDFVKLEEIQIKKKYLNEYLVLLSKKK